MSCNDCNSTPQPCCQDCPETNPCENGCLDIIPTSCVEYDGDQASCLSITSGNKLDFIIRLIDDKLCELESGGDKYAKVTSLDPISGYLNDKIITCNFLTKETITSGGQQKLRLCLNTETIVSANIENPIFMDLDGLNINYTTLVETIVNNPTLVQMLCNVISGCTPE